MNNMSRLKDFTDNEVYMLKRMAMESSWNICMKAKYSEEEIKLYEALLNELGNEDSNRMYGKDR